MQPIFAYVGPGVGLSLIGALIGLLGSFGISLMLVVLHPLRRLLRRWRRTDDCGGNR